MSQVLSLPKRPRDLLVQWLEQILQRGALARPNENLCRHAWYERKFLQSSNLLFRERYTHQVIGLIVVLVDLVLVFCEVGADMGHLAEQIDHRALVPCHNPYSRSRPQRHLVDVLGRDLGFDDKFVRQWNDLHNGFALSDNASDGMNRKLMDGAVLGGSDVNVFELLFGCDELLTQHGDLALGLTQFL